jgi:hypothetical protein
LSMRLGDVARSSRLIKHLSATQLAAIAQLGQPVVMRFHSLRARGYLLLVSSMRRVSGCHYIHYQMLIVSSSQIDHLSVRPVAEKPILRLSELFFDLS